MIGSQTRAGAELERTHASGTLAIGVASARGSGCFRREPRDAAQDPALCLLRRVAEGRVEVEDVHLRV